MKNSAALKSFTRFSIIGAGVLILAGVVMLLIMGGNTFPTYTTLNLELSMFIKALVAAVLVWALTLGYFAIFYKKQALKLSLVSLVTSVVTAAVSFAICVICRAPLGDFTFAVMVFATLLSYVSSILYTRYLFDAKSIRKSKNTEETTPEDKATARTLKVMLYVLLISAVALCGAFAVSLIFGSQLLCMYALPGILTAATTVIFTLSVGCNFINK